ncbi:acetolactate synthase 2 small subunit [Thalassomonas viridans]|uniref:Acetolactate synthase 2 small subunit n=1 Tax=Thalassomonas viridans TaxID=137584 RepID=A0AAE9Z2E2_9GAMM|nr:acetolactate synthase 2 small subunit [Thalassomonas viridans]WDE05531.1 acetolactate synthase 2 small subunit [Thalassomonas viridans]
MNQHTLKITASDQPTVLERLLQVTRYRGFVVTGMTMFPQEADGELAIEISVRSENSIDNLYHQLDKLFDIRDIRVDNTTSLQCRA